LQLTNVAQIKFRPLGKLIENLVRILLIALLFFIVLANIPSLFPDGASWVDDSVLGILLFAVLLYVARVSLLKSKNGDSPIGPLATAPSNDTASKQGKGIGHLQLGVLGGLVGISLAGLLMRTLALISQDVYISVFILCGALGGLGFGALTNGNNKLRGIIGCAFGLIAILFGLIMTYSAPLVVGYMSISLSNNSVDALTPIYKWHEYTFVQFLGIQLMSLHGFFYTFFGLLAAYLGGSRPSLKTKPETLAQKSANS